MQYKLKQSYLCLIAKWTVDKSSHHRFCGHFDGRRAFHKRIHDIYSDCTFLGFLGWCKTYLNMPILWHRIRTLGESSHCCYCGHFHFKVLTQKAHDSDCTFHSLIGQCNVMKKYYFCRNTQGAQVMSSHCCYCWHFHIENFSHVNKPFKEEAI